MNSDHNYEIVIKYYVKPTGFVNNASDVAIKIIRRRCVSLKIAKEHRKALCNTISNKGLRILSRRIYVLL